MKELNTDLNKREELAMDCSKWRSYFQAALKVGEQNIITVLESKRRLQKEKVKTANTVTNGLDP